MLVGEAPGEHEAREGHPFVGASGEQLDRLLHDAGIQRSECFVTNVIRSRPPANNLAAVMRLGKRAPAPEWVEHRGAWFAPHVAGDLAELDREVEQVRPSLVFAFGNAALWALTGRWGITDWRGSTLEHPSSAIVVPTYHPAAVLRQWSWRPYVIRDLARGVAALERGCARPAWRFTINPSFEAALEQLSRLIARLDAGERLLLACDIETRRGQIDCIGIAWSRLDALCIPLWSRARPNHWGAAEELALVVALRRLLTHANVRVTGQNFAYDIQYIWRQWGFKPRLAFDTMVAHHTLWPGTNKDLNTLSSLYCDYHSFWKHESKEADEREDDAGRWGYNCRDCVATWEIAEALGAATIAEGQVEQCVFQHQMWWHALDTMIQGVRTDAPTKKELSGELREEIASREAWIEKVCGHPLNLRSPKQLKDFFYADLQLPQVKIRTKEGVRVSCNEEALSQIAARTPFIRPLVRRILEIRSLGVFRSTFLESKLDTDSRIRCSYNVAGTVTFRLSSSQNAFGSGMNLQNVPEGGESDDLELVLPNIRKLFLPDEGMEMFDMDLSSADLRIVVCEAGETELQALLDAGLNPYVEIAKEFYHDGSITRKHPHYKLFKNITHGTHYLGTAAGLAKRYSLAVRDVERTQRWYLDRFPRIERWQQDLKDRLASTRTVSNAYGNRWYCFDRVEGGAFRAAAAWIPQSTIALHINRIWDRIRAELRDVRILLQVHDSLVGQYPREHAEHYRAALRALADSTAVPYPAPLSIPCGLKWSTKSWGDCA